MWARTASAACRASHLLRKRQVCPSLPSAVAVRWSSASKEGGAVADKTSASAGAPPTAVRISAADLAPKEEQRREDAGEEEYWEPPELPGLRLRKGETIYDRYENTKDPELFERIFKMAFDSLPRAAGPRKGNQRRRRERRELLIDKIRGKVKMEVAQAHAEKLDRWKARRARDFALVEAAVKKEATA